jgi:hypothetical protein
MTRTAASAGNFSKWQGCNPPHYLQFYVGTKKKESAVSIVKPARSSDTSAHHASITTPIRTLHTRTHAVQRQPHIPNPLPPRSCPFTYINMLHARNAEERKPTPAIPALVTENKVLSKKEGTPEPFVPCQGQAGDDVWVGKGNDRIPVKHQTSAQPPSSSLYEASDSGLSGLSTSFATRSSARPDP